MQNARDRLIAPNGHGAAVALERHLGQTDGLSEGNGGAARSVPALLGAGGFDETAGPRLDADRNRNAPAFALRLEQKPHLAADRHAPQVGLFLNRLADSVDVAGAHAGPGKQDRQAIAASELEGLQLGLDLRRSECRLHGRGQGHGNHRDQRERRNSAYPTARLAIHTPNQIVNHARFRRFISRNRQTTTDPDGARASCQSLCEQHDPKNTLQFGMICLFGIFPRPERPSADCVLPSGASHQPLPSATVRFRL